MSEKISLFLLIDHFYGTTDRGELRGKEGDPESISGCFLNRRCLHFNHSL
jgi:hypothetical protein